jgi:hypothetical protein
MHTDIFNPPAEKTQFTVLNLGAGVQSSCLALMAAKGEVGPMPDFAVFADTQAEPASVYKWLDWLEAQLPYPVIRVTNGDLTAENLKPHKKANGEVYLKRLIPLFGIMPNGDKTAAIGRKCTADYKIKPIIAAIKERCGIKRAQKELTVTQWIGISYDEMQRAKVSQNAWTQLRYPLIEKRMYRQHCLEWMTKNGYPEPPRSACYYCPFHSNDEWRRLRNDDPEYFKKAVEFDKDIRQGFKDHSKNLRMEVYLHNSCLPLGEIDFDSDTDKGQKEWDFGAECEGMCGM